MTNNLKKLTSIILSFTMVFASCFASFCVSVNAEPSQFEIMLGRLESLEELAVSYKASTGSSKTVNKLVLNYLRSVNYSSDLWNTLAGTADAGFKEYVSKENPDTANICGTGSLLLPNGDRTDFIHMFAVMDMESVSQGDVGGWLGDACTLVLDFKNEGGSGETLVENAKKHFRVDGHFGLEDWNADVDGANLYKAKQSDETWAECLARYFTPDLTEALRVSSFIKLKLGNNYTTETSTKSDYRSAVKSLYKGNVEVVALRVKELGFSYLWNYNYDNAACSAIADYMYEAVTAKTPDETNVKIDFEEETLTLDNGISVNSSSAFKGTSYANGDSIEPGATFYAKTLRDEAKGFFFPSQAVEFTAPERAEGPGAPIEDSHDASSITLTSEDGIQYSIDAGETWQDDTTFTDLLPNTTYNVVSRYKASDTSFASLASEATEITTEIPGELYIKDQVAYIGLSEKVAQLFVSAYKDGQYLGSSIGENIDGMLCCTAPDLEGADEFKAFALGTYFTPAGASVAIEPKTVE